MAASERDSQAGRQYDAAASSLQVSWQTLHALASETGNAVRHTFTDSAVSTSGHVQQGRQVHASPQYQQQQDHSEALLDSGEVQLKQKVASPLDITTAVQADIRNVERKMLSSDAATEVILRFNFLTEWESRVCPSWCQCLAAGICIHKTVFSTLCRLPCCVWQFQYFWEQRF